MNGSDISARLTRSCPVEADVHRRERSWTLMAGSRRLSFTRVDYHAAPRPWRVIDHDDRYDAGPRRSLMGVVAVVLGSFSGFAMLGLAWHATSAAPVAPYRLSLAIPPRAAPTTASDFLRQRTTGAAIVRPVAVARSEPMAVAASPSATMVDVARSPDPEPARLTTMQPAIGAALRTGALQQWASADGAERGFVVAGPAEHGCRTLSILTRRNGDDAVQTRRACTDGEAVTPAADTTAP